MIFAGILCYRGFFLVTCRVEHISLRDTREQLHHQFLNTDCNNYYNSVHCHLLQRLTMEKVDGWRK